jgi:hypothetical protein
MVITCALLAISGGIRFWREWQFYGLAKTGAVSPFPLNELPKSLGRWQWVEGSDNQLEPEVARVAGSSDHIVRDYIDEKAGQRVSALVLYGLAAVAFAHTPDACYPGHGYRLVPGLGPEDRELSIPGLTAPVRCRWAVYAKNVGGIERYDAVYHTFFYNGEWLPDLTSQWKSFRYHPGVFKIQLQRAVTELVREDGPSEDLLSEIIRVIIGRLPSNNPGGASAASRVAAQIQPDRRPG